MKETTVISICLGSSCYRRGNQEVLEVIKKYLSSHKLTDKVEFKGHLCQGKCAEGPNFFINNTGYQKIDRNSVIDILNQHFELVH